MGWDRQLCPEQERVMQAAASVAAILNIIPPAHCQGKRNTGCWLTYGVARGNSRPYRESLLTPSRRIWMTRSVLLFKSRRDLLVTSITARDPMYGPAARCKKISSNWQMRSCINVSGL